MSDTTRQPDEFAERSARIQQLQADALLKIADVLKRDQDIRFAPITLLLTGVASGAA
jgi:hypothetical protein